ncbi:MAG: AsmA family protein [Sideroxyarcus sp.]|nr:AsmA family protein [Sideroxyarcus sp.]
MLNPVTHTQLRPKMLKSLRVAAVLLSLAVLYVAVIGIKLDASAHDKDIADKLTAALGREMQFAGALQFEISAHPKLRVGGLRIANARGFNGDEFASLGEARLELDLWHLLWGHLQIEELSGSDVHLRLQAHKDGSNNWTFKRQAADANQPASTGNHRLLALLDIQRVSLSKLNVEYTGSEGKRHYFELESLLAHIPSGQPIALSLNGTVEKTFPYRLYFTGGTLAELVGGEQPWPVDLSLNFLSSKLTLKGTVIPDSGNIHFALATQNLTELERLLQTSLPHVGKTSLAGDMTYAPGIVKLANLDGNMGNTALNGSLDFDYGGARPRVQGQLSLPTLDTRPFMTGQPNVEDAPAQSLAEIYRDLAQANFDLRALNDTDVDLTLRVGKWLNLPGDVHDAMLQLKLDRGRLSLPIQAALADVKLSGSAYIDARKNPARFEAALGTHESSLGNLAGLLLGLPDVKGHLGRFDLRIAARGNRGAALMESLDVQLDVERGKLSYGNSAGSRPVQLALDKFSMTLPAGKALRGEARGTLLANTFSMTLHGATLTELMQQANAPIELNLQAGSASAQVLAVLQPPSEITGTTISFKLDAPHSSEVSSWLGLKPGADVPASVKGYFQLRRNGWQLYDLALQLGHSILAVEAQQTSEQNKPLVKLQLNSELIDADELQALLPEKKAAASTHAAPVASSLIDIPILPQGINLKDADITVRTKQVKTSSPYVVHDLSFDGRIRDGMMNASPFAARVASADFKGSILLDLRSQQPRADLQLSADGLDLGKLLQRLDIAHNIDARVDHVQLHLDLHSSQLGQLLAQSELSVNFSGGALDLHDANTKGTLHIALDKGELKSAPGAPVHLNLNGALDKAPVSIAIQTATAADLLNPKLSIPFQLDAATSGASIRLSGDVERPFSQRDVELVLDMQGSRFDNLNTLLRTSLPPWGPWSASGKFHMSAGGYEVSALQLKVGSSLLDGHGKLDTTVTPPRLNIGLAAPTIQIDDFRFGAWSPEKSAPAAEQSSKPGAQAQQLLSRQVMRRQNAYLAVRVEQVLSGNDALGNGKLEARLENGRAEIGPVVVDTPGGSASFRLDYEPTDTDVAFKLRAEARHFDYGILARRIDRQSEMRGFFDMDVDVSARAKQLSELMRYGKGHIDFAVWPENMKSGLLDVWAVNVLMALLPAVDATHESKVNCAIGQFTLQDGKLSHKRILVDTTRMRVFGRGNADFKTEQLRFRMKPRSKTPQFLSFAIPVQVSGSFDDFSVGVKAGDVLEVAGDMLTSVIWVPLQTMIGKTKPEDGSDVCKFK